jgi:hypothetical protein
MKEGKLKRIEKILENLFSELDIKEGEKVLLEKGDFYKINIFKKQNIQISPSEDALIEFMKELGDVIKKKEKCIFHQNFSSIFIERLKEQNSLVV